MKKKILAIALSAFVLMLVAMPVLAGTTAQQDITSNLKKTGTGIYGAEPSGDQDLAVIVGNIINVVLGFLGVILVIIIIYGGFLYMTAGGNTDQVSKAKSWIINGIIGLIIILLAYAITDFVISNLYEATSGS